MRKTYLILFILYMISYFGCLAMEDDWVMASLIYGTVFVVMAFIMFIVHLVTKEQS